VRYASCILFPCQCNNTEAMSDTLLRWHRDRLRARRAVSEREVAWAYLGTVSLIYLSGAVYFSIKRSFWYDELFTFYIASLPDAGSIWRALVAGVDNHPPLDYLVRHFSMQWFGATELGARIPSILGIYVAFVSVFVYARKVHSTLAGILASSLLLASPAAVDGVQGRSYALTLAFGSVAVVLWRTLDRADWRNGWPRWIAFGFCMTGMIWCHYYGILAIAAFAVAGLVSCFEQGRIRWPLWGTFSISCIAVLPVVPFALHARSYSRNFWAPAPSNPVAALRGVVESLGVGLDSIFWALLCVLVFGTLRSILWSEPVRPAETLSLSQKALLLGLAMGPVLQWMLAITVTHAFVWHYANVSATGACILTGIILARSGRSSPAVVLAVAAVCILQTPNSLVRFGQYNDPRKNVMGFVATLDREIERGGVTVAPSGFTYLQYFYYGSPRVKRNLYLLTDDEFVRSRNFPDNNEIIMPRLATLVPLRYMPLDRFLEQHPRFELTKGRYDPSQDWLVTDLLAKGYQLNLARPDDPVVMYRCSPPEVAAGKEGPKGSFGVRQADPRVKSSRRFSNPLK
jgi:hypothetical protein